MALNVSEARTARPDILRRWQDRSHSNAAVTAPRSAPILRCAFRADDLQRIQAAGTLIAERTLLRYAIDFPMPAACLLTGEPTDIIEAEIENTGLVRLICREPGETDHLGSEPFPLAALADPKIPGILLLGFDPGDGTCRYQMACDAGRRMGLG